MSGFFVVLSLDAFLDNYSYFGHRVLDKQINRIRGQRELLQEIKKDQKNIKQLKNRTDRKIRREILYEKDSEDIYHRI
jgi:hypothetical protein